MQVAREGNAYIITVAPKDEDSAAVTPNAIDWTLKNEWGRVVNSRRNVALTPATAMTIVLAAGDLSLDDGSRRLVLVSGTYNSSNGTSQPLQDWEDFSILAPGL